MQDAPKPLKRIFSPPKNLPFLKESLLSVGIRSVSSLTVGKIIALNFGPAGTALFGQLVNLYSGFSVTGTDGLGRAVVKDGAAFDGQNNEKGVGESIGTGLGLLLGLLVFQWLILVLLYFASGWSVPRFEGSRSLLILGLFSLITLGYFFGNLFLVRKRTQLQAYSTTLMSLGALAGLGLAVWLHQNLQNSLLLLFGFQALAGFLAFGLYWKKLHLNPTTLIFNSARVKSTLVFAFTIASTAMLSKLGDYGLIQWAITRFGETNVGIWLAMNKIADSLNIPVLVVVNTILFPILASKKDSLHELRAFFRPIFGQGLMAVSMGILFLFLFYPILLNLLFSSDFRAEIEWKYSQLVGDFFRISSYIICVLPLALGHTRFYFWLELGSIATIILISVLFAEALGFQGLFVAHAVRYFLYWLVLAFKYRSLLF